jgi:hypothetical protein
LRRLIAVSFLAVACGGNPVDPGRPTPPPSPPPAAADTDPLIAAAGDLVCGRDSGTGEPCRHRDTSEILMKKDREHRLAAVLPLGDLQYEFGLLEDFEKFYDPSWGRLKAVSRPALGNHEYDAVYEGGTPAGYFDYWNGKGGANGPAGPRERGYYSFDVGAWHLIALNSNCRWVGGCQAGSPQERWLRSDLEQNPRPCTLAYWHHPRFNSGHYGNTTEMQPIWQALQDAGADVVLSAHEHIYERFAPQTATGAPDERRGLRQFTVGTGGRTLYEIGTLQPNSAMRYKDDYGVLFLSLRAGSYAWTYVTVGGGFTDTGNAECH